jgi:hypothetical protein
MAYFDPTLGVFILDKPKLPDCEFTAPGSETEAIDCWEPATLRHVRDGVTVGVFCADHSIVRDGSVSVELIETNQE